MIHESSRPPSLWCVPPRVTGRDSLSARHGDVRPPVPARGDRPTVFVDARPRPRAMATVAPVTATVARRRERAEGATEARGWGDTVGQDRARERFPLDLSGEGRHLVPGTARIDRPDAAVVSVVVVAVRGFVMRTRFRDRGWRAESRGDDERARVAHAPRRVLIVAVTLSHVELSSACRAGTTGRTKGRGESFEERPTSRRFQKWKSPDKEIKLRAFRGEDFDEESYPF